MVLPAMRVTAAASFSWSNAGARFPCAASAMMNALPSGPSLAYQKRLLVPIHHGAFALSYEQLDEPARWLVELAKQRGVRDHVMLMGAGQSERIVGSSGGSSGESC